MFFQLGWFSTKCKNYFFFLILRIVGKNPFKGKTYQESMRKNYHCYLDFDRLRDFVSDQAVEFLSNLVVKDPNMRLTSETALEEEAILANFMDENADKLHMFRNKIKKAPSL